MFEDRIAALNKEETEMPLTYEKWIYTVDEIIDDDRRINAQRFEEQFYQSKAAPAVEEAQEETKAETALIFL